MHKNILFFSVIGLALGACNYYSDENVFVYQEENTENNVSTTPFQRSSNDLIVPEDLKQQKYISQNSQSDSISEEMKIPVTYGKMPNKSAEIKPDKSEFDVSEITPHVYAIAATRATNKMLDETQNLYVNQSNKPKILVLKAEKLNQNLPDGFHYADKVVYDIISGSQNFMMVSQLDDADYVLKVEVDALQNQNAPSPIILYKLTLQDKNGKQFDSWTQDIRQLQNDDKSWW